MARKRPIDLWRLQLGIVGFKTYRETPDKIASNGVAMTQTDWEKLYIELVEALQLSTEAHDKRKHPRLIIPEKVELSVHIEDNNHRVVDISPGGISFLSHMPLSGGREVSIVYDNTFEILSNIVYCRVEELEPPEGGESFRIGAEFVADNDGFRIMVLVLEFYSARLNKGSE